MKETFAWVQTVCALGWNMQGNSPQTTSQTVRNSPVYVGSAFSFRFTAPTLYFSSVSPPTVNTSLYCECCHSIPFLEPSFLVFPHQLSALIHKIIENAVSASNVSVLK